MNERTSDVAARLRAAGLDWIVPQWPAPAAVQAFVTTRGGGVSEGAYATMNLGRSSADVPAAIAENQRRFESYLPASPARLRQVHGVAVATLTRDSAKIPYFVADAAVTRERGVVCAVQTADCLPVMFAAPSGHAAGIAHAGWRGLAAGVLEATVRALRELDPETQDLLAWLGPGIGAQAFEVGDDVHAAFVGHDAVTAAWFVPHRPGKWHADLYGLARYRLERCGVTWVGGGGYCTYTEHERFFSYRRERESGRMASAIWLAEG